MNIVIRPYRLEDAEAFAQIHYDAVHHLGKNHYPKDVLDAWSQPVNEARIRHVAESAHLEIRVIAEYDGKPVGLGCVVPAQSELRACYVASAFASHGIGRKIMEELESIAVAHGVKTLTLDSSLNAKDFYGRNGYQIIEKSMHALHAGIMIECYKMKKQIA